MICVGGGSMKRFGFLDRAVSLPEGSRHGSASCSRASSRTRPSRPSCRAPRPCREFEPDWIVAMGGGSPIDAAKAMWIKYEYPDITFEDMCKVFGIPTAAHEGTLLRHLLHLRHRYRGDCLLHHHRLSEGHQVSASLTLRSPRMSPSSTRIWPKPCPRSWWPTPVWTP